MYKLNNLYKFFYFEYATLSWPVLVLNEHFPNYEHPPKNAIFLLINKYLLLIKPHF